MKYKSLTIQIDKEKTKILRDKKAVHKRGHIYITIICIKRFRFPSNQRNVILK